MHTAIHPWSLSSFWPNMKTVLRLALQVCQRSNHLATSVGKSLTRESSWYLNHWNWASSWPRSEFMDRPFANKLTRGGTIRKHRPGQGQARGGSKPKLTRIKFATNYLKSTTRTYWIRFSCQFYWKTMFLPYFLVYPKIVLYKSGTIICTFSVILKHKRLV